MMGKHEMTSSNMNCNCTMKEMTKAKMMLTKNFDNKAPDLIDDVGDDSFFHFDNSDYHSMIMYIYKRDSEQEWAL